MFVRLTRAKRLKAGWLLALVYMLCVLAPGISFAFSDGLRATAHGLGVVHVHELSEASAQHAHQGGHVHEHSASHAHDGHKDVAYVADEAPAPSSGPHQTSGAQCCGVVCLSGLPATIVDIVKPSAPTSICASENYRSAVDNAPPRHYRPPIS
ncbi:hypothetical protein [Bradyrhizobium algeriense]|uniref:hypothetical protein n=1 Tax=Bradyrhizobium algeriense TaxID=634784 RepID=UPI000D33B80C|nr:hypothetical protein [Bradyrhizobium algeriense]